MLRMLIADDHEVVRRGLKQVLLSVTQETHIDEAKNAQEVLKKIQEKDYSVVLLDISMPGRNGLDIVREMKSLQPELIVLILSMYSEDQYAMRALKAGAAGYLSKAGDSKEVIVAIQKALSGKIYYSGRIIEDFINSFKSGWKRKPHDTLSIREMEVFHHIVSGCTPSKIAEELSISLSSVSTYRRRIMKKMNLNSIADIIKYAVENGLDA